jgi:hypothetical protein
MSSNVKRLETLSVEQDDLMKEKVYPEWHKIVLESGKEHRVDKDEIQQDIRLQYRTLGRGDPNITVAISPFMLKSMMDDAFRRPDPSDAIEGEVMMKIVAPMATHMDARIESLVEAKAIGRVKDFLMNGFETWHIASKVTDDSVDVLGDEKEIHFGLVHEVGWLSYYDYFHRIGVLNDFYGPGIQKDDSFSKYVNMLKKGAWEINYYSDSVFICQLPVEVHVDNLNRFHSSEGESLKWRDEKGAYFIHGVHFSEELYKRVTNLNMKQITEMKDNEITDRQFTAAVENYDLDRLMNENPHVKLSTCFKEHTTSTLWEIKGAFPEYFRNRGNIKVVIFHEPLKRTDPDPKEENYEHYTYAVPYDIKTAEEAMSLISSKSRDQYRKMKEY